jgi:hypothetical protein
MWIWVDDPKDSEPEKLKVAIVKNVIRSVDNGYKDDGEDFYRLTSYFKELFEDSKYTFSNIRGK